MTLWSLEIKVIWSLKICKTATNVTILLQNSLIVGWLVEKQRDSLTRRTLLFYYDNSHCCIFMKPLDLNLMKNNLYDHKPIHRPHPIKTNRF